MTDAQEIIWGDPIAVDGKRPGWLNDDEKVDLLSKHQTDWYSESVRGLGIRSYFIPWEYATAIRLPADHPHYRQPAPINWSGELEAVHEDGRVVPVKVASTFPDHHGDYRTIDIPAGDANEWWFANGVSRCTDKWRIRNVTPQPTPQADTKPDVTARMEALVRKMADGRGHMTNDCKEARAIVALLPEPVDGDVLEARGVCAGIAHRRGDPGLAAEYTAGELDQQFEMEAVVATIRGRELALAGEKEA